MKYIRTLFVAVLAVAGLWLTAPLWLSAVVHAVVAIRDGVAALVIASIFTACAVGAWKLKAVHVRQAMNAANPRRLWRELTSLGSPNEAAAS